MRRLLIPLDGTPLAEAVLPDACRLAGNGGELILVRDASRPAYDAGAEIPLQPAGVEQSDAYLATVAHRLERECGLRVRTQTFVMGAPGAAVLEAIRVFQPDMIACATHGRSPLGRALYGSVAWKILTHSPVPVLLRHVHNEGAELTIEDNSARHILVPLDGSPLAESAVPLAHKLATEWNASTYLVRVLPPTVLVPTLTAMVPVPVDDVANSPEVTEANQYLQSIADTFPGTVYRAVYVGPTLDTLIEVAGEIGCTDIVMASHGRGGLARMVLGSVADGLVHRLFCPTIIVPALAAENVRHTEAEKTPILLHA